MKKVAVIMGSNSDLPVVKGAIDQLKNFGIPFEAHVISAHRPLRRQKGSLPLQLKMVLASS